MTNWQEPERVATIHGRMQNAARRLRLPLTNRTWRGQSGSFFGAGTGSSIDFQDHRPYLAGDDPRHIDWQAYARTGHYTMKLYREEISPRVDLVVDTSESMFFDPAKLDRTCELLYFAAESAWQAGASLHAFFMDGAEVAPVVSEQLLRHELPHRSVAHVASADPPPLGRVPWRSGSLRVLVSDLLYCGSPAPLLLALSGQKGRGVILAPFCREEADPGWDGNLQFIDCEAGNSRDQRVEADLLNRYHTSYQRHFTIWHEHCRRFQVALARVPSEGTFDDAVRFEALTIGAFELR